MDSVSTTSMPPNRRRDKPQLSCGYCRQKKRRCDRQRPCQTCISRGIASSCTYPSKSHPQPKFPTCRDGAVKSGLAKRLDVLEDSLMSLIRGPENAEAQTITGCSERFGRLSGSSKSGSMENGFVGTMYVNSAHWRAILHNISDMRDFLGQERRSQLPEHDSQLRRDRISEPQAEMPTSDVPHLLSGLGKILTKNEVLSAMPDRTTVDRHVSWYLNWMPLVYLHTPSFLRQYDAFWASPSTVPILWLSILYSIMCMTPIDDNTPADMHGTDSQSQGGMFQPRYLEQVIQCLVLGDYSRGGPHAVEALHHYFVIEHARRSDVDVRNWSLYGLILRLAIQKGYHREPSLFSEITCCEGELRRRLWMMLYGMDVVISVQMGMPRLIKDEQCDTKLPRNLLDADFDEDTKELPAPRPDTEMTPVLCCKAAYEMLVVIAKIADMSIATTGVEDPCSSPNIKYLDSLLRNTYDHFPVGWKFNSLSSCLGDSPKHIANRLSISVLFQKGLIILHRQHVIAKSSLTGGRRDECIASCINESVRTCIDAALQMLEYQNLVYRESQDGGMLATLRWRLFSSPLTHEFLMATSVLCSYLYRVYRDGPAVVGASSTQVHAIEEALSRAYIIWQSQRSISENAKRAADTLGNLIGKFQQHATTDKQVKDGIRVLIEDPMPEAQVQLDGALLRDCFGLYNEGMDDFGSAITW